jgi:hypothetical protein
LIVMQYQPSGSLLILEYLYVQHVLVSTED